MLKIKCANCSSPFGLKKYNYKFCSVRCSSEFNSDLELIKKKCAMCKEDFYHINKTRKYCCYVCQRKAHYQNSRINKNRPILSRTRKCKICNKDFYSYSGVKKYCNECISKAPLKVQAYYRKKREKIERYGVEVTNND